MSKLGDIVFFSRGKNPLGSPAPTAEEFFHSLYSIVGLEQLLDNLSSRLAEHAQAAGLSIVLFEPITNRYVGACAKGIHAPHLPELNFTLSDKLIRWLNVNQVPLDGRRHPDIIAFLSPREQELLRSTGTVLIFPFIVVNRLTGALFMSGKTIPMPYTAQEIRSLAMLTRQSALAIEHAVMTQFQEEKLRKLFRADSLATVGELAAGAAHEIRNPLTSIRSTIQYLVHDIPEQKRPLMQGIIDEVDRIDQIINGLLSFSRSSELSIQNLSLAGLLDQILALLEPEFRNKGISVLKHFDPALPPVPGDAPKLKQVFVNILLNSSQAMPDGGTITVTIVPDPQRNGQTLVTIEDTGCGIAPDALTHVFDPFFTTKESGTGLGLSVSYGIINKHGGDIEIRSMAGEHRRTAVLVRLPHGTTSIQKGESV